RAPCSRTKAVLRRRAGSGWPWPQRPSHRRPGLAALQVPLVAGVGVSPPKAGRRRNPLASPAGSPRGWSFRSCSLRRPKEIHREHAEGTDHGGSSGPVRGRLFVLLRTEHDLVPGGYRGASAAPLAFGGGAITAVGRNRGRGRLVGGTPRCAGVVEVDGGPAATRTVLWCGCLGRRWCGFDVGSADRSVCGPGRFGPAVFLHLGFGTAEPCGSGRLAGFGLLGPVWALACSAALCGARAVIADRDTEPVGLRTTGCWAQRLVRAGTPGRRERAWSRVVGMLFSGRSRIHPRRV